MTWSEACDDPSLQDLPYKIELNEFGSVIMSQRSNESCRRKADVAAELMKLKTGGEFLMSCVIDTRLGVKVVDVAWLSDEFFARHQLTTPYPAAPEIGVDVQLASVSPLELEVRRELYFEQGAQEVWFCGLDGKMSFYTQEGDIASSALVPNFPVAT